MINRSSSHGKFVIKMNRLILVYQIRNNWKLFSPSPVPATLTSIYMRSVAVLKSSDRSFLNSWRRELPHFFVEEKRVKLSIKNLVTNIGQTVNRTKVTKIFYIFALI